MIITWLGGRYDFVIPPFYFIISELSSWTQSVLCLSVLYFSCFKARSIGMNNLQILLCTIHNSLGRRLRRDFKKQIAFKRFLRIQFTVPLKKSKLYTAQFSNYTLQLVGTQGIGKQALAKTLVDINTSYILCKCKNEVCSVIFHIFPQYYYY